MRNNPAIGNSTVGDLGLNILEGILKLELDRPTYERCGLVGKPIPDGGRKHAKARYGQLHKILLANGFRLTTH